MRTWASRSPLTSRAPWVVAPRGSSWSTRGSAVNWQGRNVAKRPGEERRNALTHVGRGADGILFFQWRASRSGAEKFHSAMLPHAGKDSRVFREVTQLGQHMKDLAEVRGSRVVADVAVLYDWESLWAHDLEWRPSDDMQFRERMRAYYERLWLDDVTVDFAHPEADLSGYRLVVAPSSYLLTSAAGENLSAYVAGGGTLLVGAFSGIVDEHDAVHVGGFGAPLKDALGLTVEEFLPLREGETCEVVFDGTALTVDAWAEDIALAGAEVRGSFAGGPGDALPAVTRHQHGEGTGWYVGARLTPEALAPVIAQVYADAGITPEGVAEGLETITRRGAHHDFVIAVNHREDAVSLSITGTEPAERYRDRRNARPQGRGRSRRPHREGAAGGGA
ncbi:beta-galactosidase [Demequina litorisediminis]